MIRLKDIYKMIKYGTIEEKRKGWILLANYGGEE